MLFVLVKYRAMTQNFTNSQSGKGEEMKKPPTIKRMEKEFDDLPYRYAHSGQPNHEVLKKWFSSYLSEVLEYLQFKGRKRDERCEQYAWFTEGENNVIEELNNKIEKLKGGK